MKKLDIYRQNIYSSFFSSSNSAEKKIIKGKGSYLTETIIYKEKVTQLNNWKTLCVDIFYWYLHSFPFIFYILLYLFLSILFPIYTYSICHCGPLHGCVSLLFIYKRKHSSSPIQHSTIYQSIIKWDKKGWPLINPYSIIFCCAFHILQLYINILFLFSSHFLIIQSNEFSG